MTVKHELNNKRLSDRQASFQEFEGHNKMFTPKIHISKSIQNILYSMRNKDIASNSHKKFPSQSIYFSNPSLSSNRIKDSLPHNFDNFLNKNHQEKIKHAQSISIQSYYSKYKNNKEPTIDTPIATLKKYPSES